MTAMLLTMASATKNTMTPAVSLLRSMTTLERFLCEQLVGCVICVSRGRRVSDQTDNNTLQQNTHARTCANEQHNDRSTQTLGGRGLTKAAQRTASGEKKTASVKPWALAPRFKSKEHEAPRGIDDVIVDRKLSSDSSRQEIGRSEEHTSELQSPC